MSSSMNKYEYGQIYAIEYKYEFMYEIPCNGILISMSS